MRDRACRARRRRSRSRARRPSGGPCCDRRPSTIDVAGPHEGAGIDRPRRDLAVERRAQDAVVHLERAARELGLRRDASCACSAALCAVFCSASFGETKPPSSSALHARRLVGERLLPRVDARAPASRRPGSPRWRCGSRASRAPRRASRPRPGARAPCRRTPRRAAGRRCASTHGSSVPTYVRDGRNVVLLRVDDGDGLRRSTTSATLFVFDSARQHHEAADGEHEHDERRPITTSTTGSARAGRGTALESACTRQRRHFRALPRWRGRAPRGRSRARTCRARAGSRRRRAAPRRRRARRWCRARR